MAEVQRTTQTSGEIAQRFIEFVMMQAQQASMFLGRVPHPQTGATEVNLDVARLLIDQLEMIQEKTRGNLSREESGILDGILTDLRMGFVQAANAPHPAPESPAPPPAETTGQRPAVESPPGAADEHESRKRFSKSYGP